MNISEVKYFKIHPSIGVSRLANNDDYFEFYEANAKNFSPIEDYMSIGGPNDIEPGKLRIKRQAVKFTAFAYNENNEPIGKVEDLFPNATLKWTADVGNRKLHNYSEKKGGSITAAITAKGTADAPSSSTHLDGVSPWDSGVKINLGTITGTGLFIPAKGGVTRKDPNSPIDPYPANQNGSLESTDSSCDGQISVEISDAGAVVSQPIIPAWVVSCPSQHALTLTPATAQAMRENFGSFNPANSNNNNDWLISTKKLLSITGDLYDPTGLDAPMMETMNADYLPGMEVNIGDFGRMENGTHPSDFFYPRGENDINTNEIRVENKDGSNGTIPGQLTSGLCSTWQGDMSACLNYWTAENPNQAYGENGSVEKVIYKEGNPSVTMSNPEEINKDMDFRGLVDYEKENDDIKLTIVYDPNRPSNNA